jgi:phage portal protein BeeE
MGRYIDDFKLRYPKETSLWGKKEAVWVDTADIWKLFVEIPELRAVINKRASMMSSNVPCLYDKNGEKVESHWLLDLIRKPNAIQSWADVIYTLSVQDALYSNVFAYTPVRSFNVRNLLVPLPANKVKIHTTGKRLKQMDANDLIDKFTFQYDDQKLESINWEDMLYLTTDDGMNIIKPISRIETLKFPLSNIRASYHKRNVLLENIGAIGILSAEKNDLGGPLPMTPEEKNQIQRDWFRRQRDDLIITEAKVNWTPMSFPTRDLMLFEELTEDKLAIIDAFGLNYNLFSSTTGATYSNVKDSIRMVYQDTIIPETQAMYNSMIKQFGLDSEGYYLEAEFDHLAVMQHDEKATAETQKIKVDTLEKIMAMGVNVDEDTIKNFIRFYE